MSNVILACLLLANIPLHCNGLFHLDNPSHSAMWVGSFSVVFFTFLRKSNLVPDVVHSISQRPKFLCDPALRSDLRFHSQGATFHIRICLNKLVAHASRCLVFENAQFLHYVYYFSICACSILWSTAEAKIFLQCFMSKKKLSPQRNNHWIIMRKKGDPNEF